MKDPIAQDLIDVEHELSALRSEFDRKIGRVLLKLVRINGKKIGANLPNGDPIRNVEGETCPE